MEINNEQWPIILYVGEVPIESTSGGNLLLYRLFNDYPPKNLYVVQPETTFSEKRKTGSKYETFKFPNVPGNRWLFFIKLNSLLHYWYCRYILYYKLNQIYKKIKPDIIISTVHRFSWISGLMLARKKKIILDLIIHDDWEGTFFAFSGLNSRLKREFSKSYVFSRNNFCVSPYMLQQYHRNYGIIGQLLYPMSTDGSFKLKNSFSIVPKRIDKQLTIGFAGSLWGNYVDNLICLCHAAQKVGAIVIAYTNFNIEQIKKSGLLTNNLMVHEFIDSKLLVENLANQADILYLPMDFNENVKNNMMIAFPSKMADYCMLGLPILINAPLYSSIVSWTKSLDVVYSEMVLELDEKLIQEALTRLENIEYRKKLGENSRLLWEKYFNPQKVKENFYNQIKII
jgi:hypothetical protein